MGCFGTMILRIEIIDARINHDQGKFGDNLEEFRRQHNIAELDICDLNHNLTKLSRNTSKAVRTLYAS